jgi:type 1 glutamine amidotransferase
MLSIGCRCLLFVLALLTSPLPLLAAEGQGPENGPSGPAKVLLVTGVDYAGHHWKKTAPVVREVLEQGNRLEVRIIEDPELLASDVLFDYDVVLLHFKNYAPFRRERQIRQNLVDFVRRGGGLVAIHFACGAFEDWPQFADLIGKVWDKEKTHDPRGPFTVKIVAANQPITKEMHDFAADDELYICLTGTRPVTVLATATSKITGTDQPMAFVFLEGEGRVFQTPLGHDEKAIRMPGVSQLLRRGCLWAAGRTP